MTTLLLLVGTALLCGCAPDDDEDIAAPRWFLSADYVSNTYLQGNRDIADEVKAGRLLPLRECDLPEVYRSYRDMATRMKLRPLPALYLDAGDTRSLPLAAARFTREGRQYIVVNRRARDLWSARQQVAVLGHELVHLRSRHVTAAQLARAYNHPELSVAHEMEADRVGASPLGSCDPGSLKSAIQIAVDNDMRDYLSRNPTKEPGDYNTLIGADHPYWPERKAALQAMAEHPPRACRR